MLKLAAVRLVIVSVPGKDEEVYSKTSWYRLG